MPYLHGGTSVQSLSACIYTAAIAPKAALRNSLLNRLSRRACPPRAPSATDESLHTTAPAHRVALGVGVVLRSDRDISTPCSGSRTVLGSPRAPDAHGRPKWGPRACLVGASRWLACTKADCILAALSCTCQHVPTTSIHQVPYRSIK